MTPSPDRDTFVWLSTCVSLFREDLDTLFVSKSVPTREAFSSRLRALATEVRSVDFLSVPLKSTHCHRIVPC